MYWLQQTSVTQICLIRPLFFSISIFYYCFFSTQWMHIEGLAELSPLLWRPVSFFSFLHIPILSAQTLFILKNLWFFSMLFSATGLFTHFSTTSAFVLGLYLFGLPNNFDVGTLDERECLFMFALAMWALLPCGAKYSLDSLIWSKADNKKYITSAWPVKLVQVYILFTYFEAGIQKLRFMGLDFFTSDFVAFRMRLAETQLGLLLTQYPIICRVLAFMALSLEIFAVVGIWNQKIWRILIPLLLLTHIFIAASFDVLFGPQMICLLVFFIALQPDGTFSGKMKKRILAAEVDDPCICKTRRHHLCSQLWAGRVHICSL